jgi:O-antigen ligase
MKKSKSLRKRNIRKQPESTIFYFFSAFLILILPVFHLRHVLDMSLMPRTMLLSGFLFIMTFVLFAGKRNSRMDYAVFRHWVFPVLLGFFLINIITSGFAFHFTESFFMIVKTALFICLTGFAVIIFSQTDGWYQKLPLFVILAAIISIIIGSYQYINEVVMVEEKFIKDDLPTIYNVKGLMSHKNEYSSSLMLMLPFLGYAVYISRKWTQVVAVVVLVLVLGLVFLLKTRAVWLGIMAGAFFATLFILFYYKRFALAAKWRNALLILFFAGIAGLVFLFSMPAPEDPFSPAGRIKSMTDLSLSHNVHRLYIWDGTLQMIKENPITGVGPGNWRILFQPYVTGAFERFSEINWARPHNDYLWVFAETGIFGILFFLSFFFFLLNYQWKIIMKSSEIRVRVLALFLFAGVISYLVVSFFAFPYERINHQVYLAIMTAGTIALYHTMAPQKTLKLKRARIMIPVLIVLLFGIVFSYLAIKQEVHLKKGVIAQKERKFKRFIREIELSRNPLRKIDPYSNPADYYIALAYTEMNEIDNALESINKALEVFPQNAKFLNNRAENYYRKGNLKEAEKNFKMALFYLPESKVMLANLATVYYHLEDYEKTLEALERIPKRYRDAGIRKKIKNLKKKIRN